MPGIFFLYRSHIFDILILHIHYFWVSSNYLLLNSVFFCQYFHSVLIITMCFLLFFICLGQQGRYRPLVDISWFYSVNLHSNKKKKSFFYILTILENDNALNVTVIGAASGIDVLSSISNRRFCV